MAYLQIGKGDWVLIGDGKKALLLINEGNASLLNLRRRSVREQTSAPTHEQESDRSGRTFSSFSSGHSAYEQTDWHSLDEKRFANEIAKDINQSVHEFSHLVVVAPPHMLGELRHAFSDETKAKITAEIDKDLTKHALPDIEKLLHAYSA
jgi:protein required for attachment to host cells